MIRNIATKTYIAAKALLPHTQKQIKEAKFASLICLYTPNNILEVRIDAAPLLNSRNNIESNELVTHLA